MTLSTCLAAFVTLLPRPNADPAKAVFHFEDVKRFVGAYKRGLKGDLERELGEGYLKPGSHGVKGFILGRIQNAKSLAVMVRARPEKYRDVELKANAIRIHTPAMRRAMWNLKNRYPAAVFPDVYFVVGRLNSGGTATSNGLILGIEHDANDPSSVAHLVAHELVHFQQRGRPANILERSIMEGSADFVGELISGRLTPHAENTRSLARPREQDFWELFQKDMLGTANQGRWLYNAGQGTRDWPADLGYWFGYEICREYYEASLDKTKALAEIIEVTDYKALFEKSGYAEKVKRRGLRMER